MLEPQNKHFVRDVLKFYQIFKSMFSYEFIPNNPKTTNLTIDVSCEASIQF